MSDLERRIQQNVKEWVSFADEDLAVDIATRVRDVVRNALVAEGIEL